MQDLTTGPISRHLLKTSSFMLVTMVFQTLYFLVDLYWVGRLGKEAVAAVSLAGNLMFVVLAVTQMLAVGTTTLVSHAAGSQDRDRAGLVFNQSLALAILVGAIFLAGAMSIREAYANALSADAVTATLAREYLSWFVPAMALQFGMVSMAAALRGTGNFKPGMVVQTVTVVVNLVLAPFLMFGWLTGKPMGVAGAALASLIAIALGSAWMAFYFRAASYMTFNPAQWKPQPALWKRMLAIGLPAGAEFMLMAVYLVVLYTIIRPFGAAAQAGFGIGLRILQAAFMPAVALGFAVAPVAGQNFGARKPDRVRQTFRTGAVMVGSLMVVLAVVLYIEADRLVGIFSGDPQVIAVGDEYLRIVAWSFVASGIVYVSSSMFQAMGNAWPPLMASLVRLVVMVIPAVMLSRMPGFQLRWIWYLGVGAVWLQLTMNLLLLRREFRRRLDAVYDSPGTTGLRVRADA